ncbi:hypothetical protein H5410_010237, partial [Solanum commersonii]
EVELEQTYCLPDGKCLYLGIDDCSQDPPTCLSKRRGGGGGGKQIVEGWLVEERVTYASDGANHSSVMPSCSPSAFYFDGDDLILVHSHGEKNLKNYLIPRGTSYAPLGWMGTHINGLMLKWR